MNVKNLFSILLFSQIFLGMNMAHAWTLKYNFNDGPLGVSADTNTGGDYPIFSDAAGDTVYDTCTGIILDGHCAKMQIKKGYDGWGTWGGRINFNERGVPNPTAGTEVWMSVKVFMPLDFDYTASPQLKFMRLHTRSSTVSNEGYHDWGITPDGPTHWDGKKNSDRPYQYGKETQVNTSRLFGTFTINKPVLGVWESYEWYVKLDHLSVDEGGTGRVRIWKNGNLLADYTHVKTLNTAGSYADTFIIFAYWNGGDLTGTGNYPTKNQHLFVEDLTITTDPPVKKDSFGNNFIGDLVVLPKPPENLIVVK